MERRSPGGAVSREKRKKLRFGKLGDAVEIGEDVGEVSARLRNFVRDFFDLRRVVLNRTVAPSDSARRMAAPADNPERGEENYLRSEIAEHKRQMRENEGHEAHAGTDLGVWTGNRTGLSFEFLRKNYSTTLYVYYLNAIKSP